jgi:NADPH:quinone reductase-like Zn-dependent oxidoreductase
MDIEITLTKTGGLEDRVLEPSVKDYPLEQAASAQADLEGGQSSGSLVLVP